SRAGLSGRDCPPPPTGAKGSRNAQSFARSRFETAPVPPRLRVAGPLPFRVPFGNMIAVPGGLHPDRRRLRLTPAGRLLGLALPLAGCGLDSPQTPLLPRSDFARQSHAIFLQILWWDLAIFVIVAAVLLLAILRFRERDPAALPRQVRGSA